jgi:hypothetical protein
VPREVGVTVRLLQADRIHRGRKLYSAPAIVVLIVCEVKKFMAKRVLLKFALRFPSRWQESVPDLVRVESRVAYLDVDHMGLVEAGRRRNASQYDVTS